MFPVYEVYPDTELRMNMFRHMLGRVDRTVLAPRAAETDHQIGESSVHVTFDRSIHNFISMIQETSDLSVFFEETDHRFVQSGKMIVTFVFTRVIDGAAVKDKSTAIATRIVGNSFFIGKTDDLEFECMLLDVVIELRQVCQLP